MRDVALKPPAPMGAREVVAVRARLRVSQAAFARILNVSPRTVQAWETDARRPSDAALKLLSVAKRNPEALIEAPSAADVAAARKARGALGGRGFAERVAKARGPWAVSAREAARRLAALGASEPRLTAPRRRRPGSRRRARLPG